ncbi:MAG: hypothetical protein IJ654_02500 [Bacteroidales bacterium]|nr:hypothetical protein [Bacteroidales bacterium]
MKTLFERHPLLSVWLPFLLCLLPVLVLRDFTPANELRYLSIADEALADGHWLSFSNHGIPYADKPPLYFWIVMLCRRLFGTHSMPALALFSLLPALGIVAVMDRWTFRREHALSRAAAAAMLLTTGLFLGTSVYLRMDLLMCFWIVLALRAAWTGKCGRFGFFTFLALFTKGPVGLLLPILSVLVYRVAGGRDISLAKVFNWPFWAILGGLSLLWLGGVYAEAGPEYLGNLLFHQTFDRAVHAFHHQAPFWYYGAVIWGVAAPWCLLTVPAIVVACLPQKPDTRRSRPERFYLSVVLTGLVLLSLFSSKLAIYLLPQVPFWVSLFVQVGKRRGWEPWMRGTMGVTAALWALVGAAVAAAYFCFGLLSVPAEYDFIRTPLLIPAGCVLLAGAILALVSLKTGWQRPVLALSASLMLTLALASPLLPQVNARIGYRQLSEEVALDASVCTLGLKGGENIDVYLHRPVKAVDPDAFLEDPAVIPDGAAVILSEKADAAVSGRYSGILKASGRTRSLSPEGLYGIWR